MILRHVGDLPVWFPVILWCTIIGHDRKLVYKEKKNTPHWSSWIFLHLFFVTQTQLQVFLHSCASLQNIQLEPKPRFLHNPRGMLHRPYLLLLEHAGSKIHGLIAGRQCLKASCNSHSGNVSAFNGIVNRNAFPRGSEEDWHCCSDCYTPNSGVSHINIPILSHFQC